MTRLKIPEWVTSISVNNAVYKILGKGCKVLTVSPNVDDIQFRNCTILLPIKVRVQLKDQTIRKLSFILKTQNNRKFQAKVMSQLKMFFREHQMYHNILPKLEKLYQTVGKSTNFGPRAYRLDYGIGVQYILLEDLAARGYRNIDRNVGFDEVCLKQVLKKLAEFHAASAVYVEKFGMFSKLMTVGVYSKDNKLILQELNDADPFMSQLRRWRVGGQFHGRLIEKEEVLVDLMLENHKVKRNEFNVLNHSDLWMNNIMFKYDAFGSIEDTAFLDYQVVKFGSPAIDLFYTILSSAQMEIKLTKFDDLVQYYFYHLLENLKYLNYQQSLPQLYDIQNALNANGLSAYVVVTRVLPIVMMNKFEDETNDNYASKMKCLMYTNRKYIQAMNNILPWMDSRGLLDWQ